MDKSTRTESRPKVSLKRRLDLCLAAAYEIEALARSMRPYVAQMVSAETGDQEAVLYAFLDRLEVVGDELAAVATAANDGPKTLGARLRTL